MILALKLLLAPLLIYGVTLAGRRWGPTASGFLIGLPLVSGPISFILACEYGPDFASRSAVGNLESALLVLVCSRKRSLHMTEEF